MDKWPFLIANRRAVYPLRIWSSRVALLSVNNRTAAIWPSSAAISRGVAPLLFLGLISEKLIYDTKAFILAILNGIVKYPSLKIIIFFWCFALIKKHNARHCISLHVQFIFYPSFSCFRYFNLIINLITIHINASDVFWQYNGSVHHWEMIIRSNFMRSK